MLLSLGRYALGDCPKRHLYIIAVERASMVALDCSAVTNNKQYLDTLAPTLQLTVNKVKHT